MRKSILAMTLASTAALGACATNSRVAQDAAIGAAGGAAVGAVVPGVSVIEGAAESISSLLKLFSGYLSDRLGKRKWLVVGGYALASFVR